MRSNRDVYLDVSFDDVVPELLRFRIADHPESQNHVSEKPQKLRLTGPFDPTGTSRHQFCGLPSNQQFLDDSYGRLPFF